ncbi:hypothetical protein ACFPRL_31990 [Pseudoclavibacter helvolus]
MTTPPTCGRPRAARRRCKPPCRTGGTRSTTSACRWGCRKSRRRPTPTSSSAFPTKLRRRSTTPQRKPRLVSTATTTCSGRSPTAS